MSLSASLFSFKEKGMYRFRELTIRTDNSEGGIAAIAGLWKDVADGRYPVAFDGSSDVFPVACYHRYESDEKGAFDYTIMSVTPAFIAEKEAEVRAGAFVRYEATDRAGDIAKCTADVWKQVWEDSGSGKIARAFACDYEMGMTPACTADGSAYCRLYISVR